MKAMLQRSTMMTLPQPPDLKPTIIQMQNNDTEEPDVQDHEEKPKKKRRRSSSSLISQNEIEKRRREHKTAHSIIEKKRRIRMNREFEALKFLIPACRNNLNTSNNNGEGMYKLTILQATVDYIRYLHQVVGLQNDELKKLGLDEDIGFIKADVDTDQYRNLDNEYSFQQLFDSFNDEASSTKSNESNAMVAPKSVRQGTTVLERFQPLPSPIITPELYPSGSISSQSSMDFLKTAQDYLKSDFQFPKNSSSSQGLVSNETSPQMMPGSSALEIINESMTHEASATKALLSMKGDSMVTSIRSLLN
jgi:hypothetical protein